MQDIFFLVCAKAKDTGHKPFQMTRIELEESVGYKFENWDVIRSLLADLSSMVISISNAHKFAVGSFFHYIEGETDTGLITIHPNDKLFSLVENVISGYTAFALLEFTGIRSTYSKNLYRQLMAWKKQGEYQADIETFRTLLDIPEKYMAETITRKVLAPIMKELPKHFKNLKLEKIKNRNKIVAYKFMWDSVSEVKR
jgi:plasmid replication initiation protein